jgi:hypothetical protein
MNQNTQGTAGEVENTERGGCTRQPAATQRSAAPPLPLGGPLLSTCDPVVDGLEHSGVVGDGGVPSGDQHIHNVLQTCEGEGGAGDGMGWDGMGGGGVSVV